MTYYGIYKITNLTNGKMYIGRHKTDNLDDGYMGSGKLIVKAVKKYGKSNFRKEWLMFCEDEEELDYMEREYKALRDEFDYYTSIGGNHDVKDRLNAFTAKILSSKVKVVEQKSQ